MDDIRRDRLFLSTIAPEAAPLAREYGVGLEIAEYCTAWNMDRQFSETDTQVREKMEGVSGCLFHGPFNELFPCAIDPKVRELAAFRYQQALELAEVYRAEKVVFHAGFVPSLYYECWFEEQSVLFWREFLAAAPGGAVICLENVLETRPEPLLRIMEGVGDSRLRLCLDLGHVNAYSERPVREWLELLSPYIAHFHLHNNRRDRDAHGHLSGGTMDMRSLLPAAVRLCPKASFTLEIPAEPGEDLRWLSAQGLLR